MRPPLLDRLDRTLLAAGVVGLVLYLLILPHYHPDAAATFGVGQEEAIERAAAFAEQAGYSTDGLVPTARLARSPHLLDSLQTRLGRRSTIEALLEGERDRIPAFFWHVQWHPAEEGRREEGPLLRMRILPNGAPWSMAAHADHSATRAIDAEALQNLLEPGEELPPEVLLEGFLSFDLVGSVDLSESLPPTDLAEGAAVVLGPDAAAAIARAHLDRTAQGELPLVATRVESLAAHGRAAVRVVFENEEPVLGQSMRSTLDVAATGTLLAMEAVFNEAPEQMLVTGTIVLGAGASAFRNALKYGGYAALILFLVVVTLRRLSARAVDTRAALKDALAVGVISSLNILLSAPVFWHDLGMEPVGFYIFLIIVVLSNGFILAAITFITTAGGDALARAHDIRPIWTFTLAREGSFVNVPVGRSVLRGVGLAGGVLGVVALLMVAFGETPLPVGTQATYFDSQNAIVLIGSALTGSFWYSLILVFAVFVAVGAVLDRWRPALLVPGLAVVLAAVGVEAVKIPAGPEWVMWIGALLLGAFLADAYRRTDALTVFVALTVAGTIWWLREPLLVPGSRAMLDLLLCGVVLAVLVGVGLRGVSSGKTAESLPVYEPAFVLEQRERARLQRELEIAREVQQSFLPRSVPEIVGLDLAARCVPAEEVGGDYYDLLPLGDGRLAVIIGDVSGKGIQAAFYMTLVKGNLQSLAHEIEQPALVLQRLNRHFRRSVPRGIFVSMIYGVIDVRQRTITFARAGHTPLIIKRENGGMESLRPPGVAIGMADDATFAASISEETVTLSHDDLLVLYTDGVSEAMDADRIEFTDERVLAAVDRAPARAEGVLDVIVDDVQVHVSGARQHDDITTVVVRIIPTAREADPAAQSPFRTSNG